jgi:hypothetical protein
MFVSVSTGVKARYLLENLALTKDQVRVFGNGSLLPAPSWTAEWVVVRPVNVPNRLSATITPHR